MAYPSSYKAFRRAPGENAKTIVLGVENTPPLRPNDVLVKIHAVALNYRDVGMLHGKYPVPVKDRGIPASDCAGEEVASGSAVQGLSIGDRVSPIFDLNYIKDVDSQNENAQLGGTIDGVLRK
jgi:NADPH:quinone reductase-like Zn-dependent oxidoreductase